MSNRNLEIIEGHVYSFKLGEITIKAMVVRIENGYIYTETPGPSVRPLPWNTSIEEAQKKACKDITDDPIGQDIIAKLVKRPRQRKRSEVQRSLIKVTRDYRGHRLAGWQSKLESNFAALKTRKFDASPEIPLPLYALEHGLDDVATTEMRKDLQSSFRSREIELGSPPLPWVVHASEIGLRFDGNQYWPLFEEDFPGWQEKHRTVLASLFRRFNDEYGGATPVPGRWTDHFNRICLPITHSILPQIYQRKLTECLGPLMRENRFFRNLFDDSVRWTFKAFPSFPQRNSFAGYVTVPIIPRQVLSLNWWTMR